MTDVVKQNEYRDSSGVYRVVKRLEARAKLAWGMAWESTPDIGHMIVQTLVYVLSMSARHDVFMELLDESGDRDHRLSFVTPTQNRQTALHHHTPFSFPRIFFSSKYPKCPHLREYRIPSHPPHEIPAIPAPGQFSC